MFLHPSGAHDRTRTGDPVLTKNVLYLLSYVGSGCSFVELEFGGRSGSALRLPVSIRVRSWWRGQDSNLRSPSERRVYSPVLLAAQPPRLGIWLLWSRRGDSNP